MSLRRRVYVELNRPMIVDVYAPSEDDVYGLKMILPSADDYLYSYEYATDFFELDCPALGSDNSVWLIRSLNFDNRCLWRELCEWSVEDLHLDSSCSADQIVAHCDMYQRGWEIDYDHYYEMCGGNPSLEPVYREDYLEAETNNADMEEYSEYDEEEYRARAHRDARMDDGG